MSGFRPTASVLRLRRWRTKLEQGQTLLLENLRFHAEEEANDPEFARHLAKLCDYYVNDAFGSAHRAHASTEGITHFVEKNAAGLLMEKELEYLGKALSHPQKPFVAILGGAKVSDKIGVIQHLMTKVDALIIGGGMAYTFLKAQGHEIGKSLLEADKLDLAKQTLAEAKAKHVRFLLPVDHVVADKVAADARIQHIGEGQAIPADMMALDIGPKTIDCSLPRSAPPAPSCGTARWACSKSMPSPREPRRLRTRWPTTAPPPQLSAAAIALQRSRPRAWPTRFRTSRPVVALRWSFWKARSCQAWKR